MSMSVEGVGEDRGAEVPAMRAFGIGFNALRSAEIDIGDALEQQFLIVLAIAVLQSKIKTAEQRVTVREINLYLI